MLQPGAALTALRFDEGGLHVAAGTADGKVALFDLRSSRPVVVKDHMYGTAITSIAFHSVVGGLAGSGDAPRLASVNHQLARMSISRSMPLEVAAAARVSYDTAYMRLHCYITTGLPQNLSSWLEGR